MILSYGRITWYFSEVNLQGNEMEYLMALPILDLKNKKNKNKKIGTLYCMVVCLPLKEKLDL